MPDESDDVTDGTADPGVTHRAAREASDEHTGESPQLIPVRRRPNVLMFVLTGVVLGIIAAVVVANLPTDDANYSMMTTFGYFAAIFGLLGAMLGGIVGVLLDRRAGR